MTPPDPAVVDAALLLRLIERLHAQIWRAYAEDLDPALDLVDAWLDAPAALDTEPHEPRLRAEPLLDIF